MVYYLTQSIRAILFAIGWILLLVDASWSMADEGQEKQSEQTYFFENKIRPALVTHCLECHSTKTEASGGLLLDSLAGWQAGGDSGPSIVPGDVNASRLMNAISYDDAKLQMPPKSKLSKEVIDALSKWIADGAFDPRVGPVTEKSSITALPVERAQDHW
ncbi:MAG TPA: c-type cytochrome domain-containing protein, partial [Pirellula sp.]|nr:c-type cytochrome domain-containing protein [Pirellula sp.]